LTASVFGHTTAFTNFLLDTDIPGSRCPLLSGAMLNGSVGQSVPWSPVPERDHIGMRLAVFPLWCELSRCGGDDVVLDILVQPKRDRFAAIRFFRKLLRAVERTPRVIVTDKLRSYGAAKRVVMPGVTHRQHRYLNNRAENSHQPTRERERRMRRFKSGRHAQRFVEVHGIIASQFRPRRHLLSAAEYRQFRSKRFRIWNQVTGTSTLA
jgi:hypothetical protein